MGITVGTGTTAGINITGNTIYKVRDGVVVQYGNTATVSNNIIHDTKGGVMNYTSSQVDANNRMVSGNSWGTTHNEWDIVWNSATYTPNYNQDVLVLSGANNSAYVLDRRTVVVPASNQIGNRSHVWVNTTGTLTVGSANGNVNLPYATIQLGVDAVVPGGIVNVPSGTYNENVTIGKSLTLVGTGVTKPIISGVSSNYIVKVDATNGVTLDNLEINGGGSPNTFVYGVFVNNAGTSGSPIELKNSTIKNVWSGEANGVGVEGTSYVLVHNNTITSFNKNGIRFVGSQGKFYNNTVTGDSVDGNSRVQNLVNLRAGSSVEIYNNSLSNAITDPLATPTWGSTCILVSAYPDSNASSANIHNNEISFCDTGIVITSVYATTDTSSAIVANNNLHNLSSGINFEQNTGSAIVHNNNFETVNAITAETSDGPIVNPPTVNATNNWWGDASGPTIASNPSGIGGVIYNSVSYFPWYINTEMTTLSDATVTNATYTSTTEGQADLPVGATEVTLTDETVMDLSAGLVGDAVTLNSGVDGSPIVLTNSDLPDVSASIPDGTIITGPTGWDGIVTPPISGTPAGGDKPAGFSVGGTVINVGSPDGTLVFDNAHPVTLLLTGVTGAVGYRPSGSNIWTQITNTCGGTYDAPTAPTYPGECAINNGADTKIVTFHFTSFGEFIPDPTPTPTPVSSSGGGGGPIGLFGTVNNSQTLALAPATGLVLGVSTFSFNGDLRQGASNDDVRELQTRLTDEGVYTGPITGYFGPLTLKAVIAYQTREGLPQTGFFGPMTRGALNSNGAVAVGTVLGASTSADAEREAKIESIRVQIQALMVQIQQLIAQRVTQ
ncbi:MAG: peptidoglycan-binding protein [Candidatus Zambryskibacteria bacterium]|nr:peptidoglycan-binding protein [Candidatus Zambryskibacteria bacterium]